MSALLGDMLVFSTFQICVFVVVGVFVVLGLARKPHRRCPRCQTLNRPPARYCAHCGARLNVP
ncbi:MAG: zinc-ribbon domain-containing protein [Planctomycetota bacterium]|jgi:hypothetical protein